MNSEEIFDEAMADLYDQDGRDAVFTPSTGDSVDCKVELERDVDLEPAGYDSQVWNRGITIEAILSVIGKEPDQGDVFTVADIDYTVQTVQENDGRFVKVVVK